MHKLSQKTRNPPERRADDDPVWLLPERSHIRLRVSTLPGRQVGMGVGPFLNAVYKLARLFPEAQTDTGHRGGGVQATFCLHTRERARGYGVPGATFWGVRGENCGLEVFGLRGAMEQ
jgi:hypothetical protein